MAREHFTIVGPLSDDDQTGLGFYQVRDGQAVHGHALLSARAVDSIRSALRGVPSVAPDRTASEPTGPSASERYGAHLMACEVCVPDLDMFCREGYGLANASARAAGLSGRDGWIEEEGMTA